MADSWVSFLADYRGSIEQTLRFVLVFVVAGLIARTLLRKIVFAADPAANARHAKKPPARATRIWLAVVSLAAWSFAFVVGTQGLSLRNASRFVTGVVGYTLVAAAILVAAGLVVYSFSAQGHEFILSLFGGWYLRQHMKGGAWDKAYDLGEGKQGKVTNINSLHTDIELVGGGKTTVPNAFLMRRLYGFGKRSPGRDTETGSA